MTICPSVDECRDRLHRAGWSIGDMAIGPDHALVDRQTSWIYARRKQQPKRRWWQL